jgi:hypothetical protein
MRKSINFAATVLFSTIFSASAWAQVPPPPVKEWEYKESERKEEDLTVLKQERKEYDPTGQMVKYILHIANPILELVKSLEVEKGSDTQGKYEQVTKYDEGGEPLMREKVYMHEYGKHKLRVESTDFTIDSTDVQTRVWKYSEEMLPQSTLITNKAGKKIGEETWKYNKVGEEIKYTKWELDKDGHKSTEEKTIEYNDDGSFAKSLQVQKIGGDELKEEIIFERGRVKEKKRYKNGEVVSSFGGKGGKYDPSKAKTMVDFEMGGDVAYDSEDFFDENKRKIRTLKTEGVEIAEEWLYIYDKNGNLVKTRRLYYTEGEPNGEEEEFVCEYDQFNNKTREAAIAKGLIMSEKTYTIKYFK